MSALVQKRSAQGRPMALAVTLAVHVALVGGLLAMKVVEVATDDTTVFEVKTLDDERRPDPPLVPIEPTLGNPSAVPQPEASLPVFAEEAIAPTGEPGGATIVVESSGAVPPVPAVPDTPLRYAAVRPSDDYYPPQAIHRELQGAAIVRACVDAQGRLAARPTVARSSGEPLLDGAAVHWAAEALLFEPATRGGIAVEACKEFRVSFTLR